MGAGFSKPFGLPTMKEFLEKIWWEAPAKFKDAYRLMLLAKAHGSDIWAQVSKNYNERCFGPKDVNIISHQEDLESILDFLNKAQSMDLDNFSFLATNACIGVDSQEIIFYPFTLYTNSPKIRSLQDEEARKVFKKEIRNLRDYMKRYVVKRCLKFREEKIHTLCKPLFDFFFEFLKMAEVWIATTNYDPIIEEYCKKSGTELICGFEHTSTYSEGIWKPEKFHKFLSKKNIRLIKLHGSCTWYKLNNRLLRIDAAINALPGKGIEPENAVIYPGEEEEFTDLFQIFTETLLKKVDGCIAIGYSFRDKRITDIFKLALKRIYLMIVDPQAKTIVNKFERQKDKIMPVNNELTEENLEELKRKFIEFVNKI